MKINRKYLFIGLILIAAFSLVVYQKRRGIENRVSNIITPTPVFNPTTPPVVQADHVLLNVPFFAQAPTGNWSDPRQEDGCEEASITMAWLWSQDKTLTAQQAEKAITDISDYELTNYGNYNDLDAQDTAKLMEDYYHYDAKKITVTENISIEDIKNALRQGRVVLTPANGQKLGNPNYKSPGPLTHMLVIRGFDDAKQQFITNDPGTRNGNQYRYSYTVLFNALVNYPSGHHESQVGRPNAMIAIEK